MRIKVTLALILLILITGALALFGLFGFPSPIAARPYLPEGPTAATVLSGDAFYGKPAAEVEQLAREAVDATKAAGGNAIFFTVREDQRALYRSRFFPSDKKVDPLDALCSAANAKGIAVFAVLRPYRAGQPGTAFTEGSPATSLPLAELGGSLYFDPASADYAALLTKDLSALAQRYPVAGILFADLDFTSAEELTAPLTALAAALREKHPELTLGLCGYGADSPLLPSLGSLVSAGYRLLCPQVGEELSLYHAAAATGATVFPDLSALGLSDTALATIAPLEAELPLAGILLGTPQTAAAAPALSGSLIAGLNAPLSVTALSVPTALAIGEPADGSSTTRENCLILGTSNPDAALTLDGEPLLRTGTGGTFAAFVPLALGENTFTLAQGSETVTLTVTRKAPKKSVYHPPEPDDTLDETLAGRTVRITGQIASALSDPASDSKISMTLKQGATATVRGTVETLRSGEIVNAYLLESGDYLLARNAELLDDPLPVATLSATAAVREGRTVTVGLSGGTPLCYPARSGSTLTFDFFGASLDDAALAPLRALPEVFTTVSAAPTEQGTRLTLTFAEEFALWGYDLACTESGMTLRFTAAPALSGDAAAPLAGVNILLDAGHGGNDTGAAGLTGLVGGLCEKDVNLALTLAVQQKLTQLGANVTMTRTDDSFPSLQDRYAQGAAELPDYFIALHHNSVELVVDTNEKYGLEAYFFEDESEGFAQNLLSAVSATTHRRAAVPSSAYFYVCRQTAFRSVLFEFGYLVNPAECESCFSADGLRRAAVGIANGIFTDLAAR